MHLNPVVTTACNAEAAVSLQGFASLFLPHASIGSGFPASPKVTILPSPYCGEVLRSALRVAASPFRSHTFDERFSTCGTIASFPVCVSPSGGEVASRSAVFRIKANRVRIAHIERSSAADTGAVDACRFSAGHAGSSLVPSWLAFLECHGVTLSCTNIYYRQTVKNVQAAALSGVDDDQRGLEFGEPAPPEAQEEAA